MGRLWLHIIITETGGWKYTFMHAKILIFFIKINKINSPDDIWIYLVKCSILS